MTPKSTRSDFPKNGAQLFYELARDRLANQLEHVDALDNKIGLLVSLASGLMGILAAVFALRANPLDGADIAMIVLATLAYLTAAVLGIRAYFSRSWDLGPDLRETWDVLWREDDDDLVKWILATAFWRYYEDNRTGQQSKEQALPWLLVAVVIQNLLLALALFLVAKGV